MQTWNDIVATAVVGTEQRELRLAARDDELGRLLSQISSTDRESFLLSAASVVALYRSAGVASTADTQSLSEPCVQDEASRASLASGQHLELMLAGEFSEVLPEWLAAMHRAGKRVPEEHLPELLDQGRLEPSLRSLIVAVLGRRGEWLAAQNPEWSYATPRDEKGVWETGTREERLLLLEHLRSVDSTRARELLATTWPQESAKDRVVFLEKFAVGLNSADESFLDQALHDRSVEVRRASRDLLAGLPNSDFSRRLRELANQVLSFKKPLIGKARIEVSLPEDPIEWLKGHDVEIDSPPRSTTKSIGPKAWALRELISLVPLTHWTERWKKTPIEIIRATDESEWPGSFVEGFLLAARRDRDPEWVEALLSFTLPDLKQPQMPMLATYLPAARLEELILKSLKSEPVDPGYGGTAFEFLRFHGGDWSDRLSRAVLNRIKERISLNVVDSQARPVLKRIARHVSPALSDELASGWPMEAESWPRWSKAVADFQSLLAFRRDMHRAISEKEQNHERSFA